MIMPGLNLRLNNQEMGYLLLVIRDALSVVEGLFVIGYLRQSVTNNHSTLRLRGS